MAYTGATIAVATVVGPLVGGFIVDAPWLGWRWCFWSAVPFAGLAMVVLQWKLKVTTLRAASTKVDWLGATLVTAAVSSLLIWISFVDHNFSYGSWQTAALLGFTALTTGLFIWVESKATNPVIPLGIIRKPTTALAITASIAVGIGMFGASVFLGQYYQLARGYSPTAAGLMMVPMMAGVMTSSVVIGRWVSRIGVWKPFVVVGAAILAVGFGAMSTINFTTPLWLIALYGAVAGLGLGMTMQNLVLAVQNSVSVRDVGAASASVTFFRSLGGAIGIQILGSVFAQHVSGLMQRRVAALKLPIPAGIQSTEGMSLDFSKLPPPVAAAVRSAFGDSIGLLFGIASAVSLVSLIAVLFMRSTRLRATFDLGPSENPGRFQTNTPKLPSGDPTHEKSSSVARPRRRGGAVPRPHPRPSPRQSPE
jgi:MFS family permease